MAVENICYCIGSKLLNTYIYVISWGFPGDPHSKKSACNTGYLGLIPRLGRTPGEGNGYHASILAWRIPWTVKSMVLQRGGHD